MKSVLESALKPAAWLLAGACMLGAVASCGPARRGVPYGPPLRLNAQEQRGLVAFMHYCHECHPEGAGGLGPALNNKPLPPVAIRAQVRVGAGAMPEFPPEVLGDEELDAIVAFVNRLRESPGPL